MKARILLFFCLFGLLIPQILLENLAHFTLILGLIISFFLLIWKPLYFVFSAALFLGGFHSWFFSQSIEAQRLTSFSDEKVLIIGTVKNYGKIQENSQQYHLKINQPQSASLLLKTDKSTNLRPGDQLRFFSKIQPINNFGDFNYRDYLWQFRVSAQTRLPYDWENLESQASLWQRLSIQLRDKAQQQVQAHLPQPHSSLTLGMTIGLNQKLPDHLESNIKNSGLQHLLVVSGSNVSLVVVGTLLLTRRLGLWVMTSVSGLGILLFWGIVGFDPPVNRAIIFGLVGGIGLLGGARADSQNLVLLAALLMAVANPLLLGLSASFYLSFVATLGMVVLGPIIFNYLQKCLPPKLNFLFSITLAAQLAVMPLVIWYFGQFPIGGFFANLIVEPLVPLVMMGGATLGLLGWLPLVGETLGLGLFWLVNLLLWIAKLFAQLPLITFPQVIVIVWFAFYFGLWIWSQFSSQFENQFYQPFLKALEEKRQR